jgi:hypothetical protein
MELALRAWVGGRGGPLFLEHPNPMSAVRHVSDGPESPRPAFAGPEKR